MAGKPVAASFRCECWLLWVLVVVGLCVPVGGGPPGFRCCLLLVAPRVFRVPSGPAAREIATREPAARSGRSRSLAKLCRRPPAPRPGSAGHAVPSMREPAARSRRSRSPARPCRRPPAPSTPVGLFIAVHIPSRPRRPRAPPPSSTARPLLSRSSRVALHTGGAFHCCAHPIQAPPPTGTAARLRGPRGALNKGRCLVCWWVIGVVLKPGQVLPPPTGTAVGHQPGAVCPALVSNLARWGGAALGAGWRRVAGVSRL